MRVFSWDFPIVARMISEIFDDGAHGGEGLQGRVCPEIIILTGILPSPGVSLTTLTMLKSTPSIMQVRPIEADSISTAHTSGKWLLMNFISSAVEINLSEVQISPVLTASERHPFSFNAKTFDEV